MGDIVHGSKVDNRGAVIGSQVIGAQRAAEPTPTAPPPRRTILMLTANPHGTTKLALDEEFRAVTLAMRDGRHRDRLELRLGAAVRVSDLQAEFLQHEPAAVHFGGHGEVEGIVLNDEHGAPALVPPAALATLFRLFSASVRCVVLNACLSLTQAEAIAATVPCVVGMTNTVTDRFAITFAEAFYRGLAAGAPIRTAFELGVNAGDLSGLPATARPVLLDQQGRAATLRLTD